MATKIDKMIRDSLLKNKSEPNYKKCYKSQLNSIFNSNEHPKVDYFVFKIMMNSNFSFLTILLGLIYLNKVIEEKILFTEENYFYLICTSILIAGKHNEDKCIDNEKYCQITKIKSFKLKDLEENFLDLLGKEFSVDDDTMGFYYEYFYRYIVRGEY